MNWKLAIALALLVLGGLGAAAVLGLREAAGALQSVTRVRTTGFGGQEDDLDRVTRCCRFDLIDWEVHSITRWAVTNRLLVPPHQVDRGALDTINEYFRATQAIRRADFQLNQSIDPAEQGRLSQEVRRLRRAQEAIRLPVERTIGALVSSSLEAEGIAARPLSGAPLFPPVAFTLVRPPSVLVISPRTEIKLERNTLLEPGLEDARALELEHEAAALGWSSLVEPTGGYSTYPTIVSNTAPRDYAFQAVAHEWMHTYLFLRPLGYNYFESPPMRVINETVADIVGRVIAERILWEHFGQRPPERPPVGARPPEPPPAPEEEQPPERFNFRREMRETRLEAERLVDLGRVDEAERYMEERRRLFVDHGYNIRKLNQAYFAFHGTYADSPASINPIGPQLEILFERAGSLSAFVREIERVGTFAGYRALLDRYSIPERAP